MKRKIIINCKTTGYWEIEDIQGYYEDICKTEGEEKADDFFSAGTFNGDDLRKENANHFIYGYLEGLMQHDRCPSFLYEEEIESVVIEEVKEKAKVVKCKDCKHCGFDMKGILDIDYKCEKGMQDLSGKDSIDDLEVSCDSYTNKYIEYPLTINGVNKPKDTGIRDYYRGGAGTLVKIRPCADEYKHKTYLGLLLGEIDTGLMVNHSPMSGMLSIYRHYNPAIFVPELKKIIYGMESWWGIIKSEEDLRTITNEDIDKTWYVQLLKNFSESNPSATS